MKSIGEKYIEELNEIFDKLPERERAYVMKFYLTGVFLFFHILLFFCGDKTVMHPKFPTALYYSIVYHLFN